MKREIDINNNPLMTLKFYDSNGNLINNLNYLSVVDTAINISFISISVSATSSSSSPNILCVPSFIWDSSPSHNEFNTALNDKSIKNLNTGDTIFWSTLNTINVTKFESTSLSYFNITLTCNYTANSVYKEQNFSGFLAVNITPNV